MCTRLLLQRKCRQMLICAMASKVARRGAVAPRLGSLPRLGLPPVVVARCAHGWTPRHGAPQGSGCRVGSVASGVAAATAVATCVLGFGGVAHAKPSLIAAARAGNDRLVRQILKQGADPNDTEGQLWGNTSLKEAANYGHLEVVELLIAAGADLNKADRAGETPLMVMNLTAPPYSSHAAAGGGT